MTLLKKIIFIGIVVFGLFAGVILASAPPPTEKWDISFDTSASLTYVQVLVDIENLQDGNDDFPFKMILNQTTLDLDKVTVMMEEWKSRELNVTEYTTECHGYNNMTPNGTILDYPNCNTVPSGSHIETDWYWLERSLTDSTEDGSTLRNQWEEIHIKKAETKRYRITYFFNELLQQSSGYVYMDVNGEEFYDFEQSSWWDTDWVERQTITITENAGQVLWNYTMFFNVSYEAVMQNDFEDLRFINTTDAELPYWIENHTDSEYAYVHVLLGYVDAGSTTKTIDMYYANAGAGDVSDLDAVSVISEDCEDNDYSQWTNPNHNMACEPDIPLSGTRSLLWNNTASAAKTEIIDATIPNNFTMIFWIRQYSAANIGIGPILVDGNTDNGASFWYSDRSGGDANQFWWWDLDGYVEGTTWTDGVTYRIEQVGTQPKVANGVKAYVNWNSSPDVVAGQGGYGTGTDLDRVSMQQNTVPWRSWLDNFAVFKSTGDKATEPTYVFGEPEGLEMVESEILLFLNGTEGNRTYEVGEYANFTVTTNITGGTVFLDSDYIGWQPQSGTTTLSNITYLDRIGDSFNITGYYEGNATVNSANQTYYFNVTIPAAPEEIAVDFGIIITFITDKFKTIMVR